MEQQQSIFLIASLQDIALKRVVVILWSDPDILASIAGVQFKSWSYNENRHLLKIKMPSEDDLAIEKKVKDKSLKLLLPESLKKELLHIIKPIGLQIRNWKRFHEEYLKQSFVDFDRPIIEKLCWTSGGAVNYKKTAEKIIRCETVDITKRYELACLYCLEDYIPAFWKEIPEDIKNKYYNKDGTSKFNGLHLPFCWPYILKGEISMMLKRFTFPDLFTFNQYACKYSAFTGNQAAAQYFFHKLTQEERHVSLIAVARLVLLFRGKNIFKTNKFPTEKHSEVFYYFISLMAPEQQMSILTEEPTTIFSVFLDWTVQDHVLEVAGRMWTFLHESSYVYLVSFMREALISSGYYIPKLLQEFFRCSPKSFRKCFVNKECQFGCFFRKFFELQDIETIEIILRNIDSEDRLKMLSSCHFLKNTEGHKLREKWLL